MSITVTDVSAFHVTGRVALARYLATRPGGDYAVAGCAVNAAYSDYPGFAADGTARGTGADGVYLGIGSDDYAPQPAAGWSNPTTGLDLDGSGNLVPTVYGGFTADPTDATAVADIASATADSGVTAAVAAALSGTTPGTYAVSILLDLYGSGGSTPLVPEISYGHPAGSSPNVADDDWLTVAPLDQSGSIGDYVSITWTSSNTSVVTLSPGSLLGPADVHLSATIATHASGTATLSASVVSTAAPSPGMVLSVTVTVP